MTVMDQGLQILKEVQEWDKKRYLLQQDINSIPRELDTLKREVESEKTLLAQYQDELKKQQLKQKEKEVELNSKEANIHKYEAQLTQVKTNKEYSALQDEIKSLKADNSMLEEVILKLMDDVQVGQSKVEEQKRRLAAKESEFQKKSKELEEKSKTISAEVDELTKKRAEKIKLVNPEIASLYEQVVQKRNGVALVQVTGEACPACQMQLRPQLVNEIKLKEKIVVCESCSRILFCE